MAEKISDKTIFSLLEVARSIQETLAKRYTSAFWVKAEMNKLNHYRQSGHCYPELVEKNNGRVIAQLKAVLWKDDYRRADQKFRSILKEPLKDGIKILFFAKIVFDPAHGLSLQIIDIDPAYTLGDLEREKLETIQRLQQENVFHQNKTLQLPLLPKRIAVLSVETSKGLADFNKIIDTNPWNYKFHRFLFPCILQGDRAVGDMLCQLRRIRRLREHFDAVAIIRGGGGDVGLSCYNNFNLAREIACFPIPVFTGIGHATNETVCEMVAFYNAITPSRLAEFFLQTFHNFSIPVREAEQTIKQRAVLLLADEKKHLENTGRLFRSVTERILVSNRGTLTTASAAIHQQAGFLFRFHKISVRNLRDHLGRITSGAFRHAASQLATILVGLTKDLVAGMHHEKTQLAALEKNIDNMSPQKVLRRGYSITLLNGQSLKNSSSVTPGDELKTVIFDGEIVSVVKSAEMKTHGRADQLH